MAAGPGNARLAVVAIDGPRGDFVWGREVGADDAAPAGGEPPSTLDDYIALGGGKALSTLLSVLSVRDVLLAGQRVELTGGNWALLRDPLTFTVRERRRLQRYLLMLRGTAPAEFELGGLVGLLVGSWSFEAPLPEDPDGLRSIPAADYELLRAAVLAELPDLQRAVHPSPGWRRS